MNETPRARNFPWTSDETVRLAVLFQQCMRRTASKEETRAARVAYRASRKRDETKRWKSYADKLEAAHERNDQKTLYRKLQKLEKRRLVPIHASELAETFSGRLVAATSIAEWRAPSYATTESPSPAEVFQALRKLRTGKASGPDSIPVELLRADGPKVVELVWPIIHRFWQFGELPTDLAEATVVPIFKAGKGCNPDDPEQYRPVSVLNTLFKLIEQSLLPRIEPFIKVPIRRSG